MKRTTTVHGPRPLRGRLRVPGDKSISHRALLFAAIAEGRSVIRGLASGEDVSRTRRMIEALGVRVSDVGAAEVRVQGMGWDGLGEPLAAIDCGNSGTTLRIGLGLLAGCRFHSVLLGDPSIARRPMLRIVDPLRAMGAHIDGRDHGDHIPLAIRGGDLRGIRHDLEVASAQVKSALLLAGLRAEGTTEVVSPAQSRDHTERLLKAIGADVETRGGTARISPGDLQAFTVDVPGDPSSAAFHVVGAVITPGSEVTIEGVSLNPTRIRFLEVLRRMGADIEEEVIDESCGEPFGVICARASELTGTVIEGAEIPLVLDEIPAIAVAAAFAIGETHVRDATELTVKESDRIGTVAQELGQMGIEVQTRRDGFTLRGGQPTAGSFKSHGDHRIAMACMIAANACPGQSTIGGWDAVGVSYPEFAEHLARLTEHDA